MKQEIERYGVLIMVLTLVTVVCAILSEVAIKKEIFLVLGIITFLLVVFLICKVAYTELVSKAKEE